MDKEQLERQILLTVIHRRLRSLGIEDLKYYAYLQKHYDTRVLLYRLATGTDVQLRMLSKKADNG